MKVLIACEESQRVCTAFRNAGHTAYSCDVIDCSGGHPEWHIKQDVIPLLDGNCEFETCDSKKHRIDGRWDLIIAHPPCTFLTVTGNRWFNEERYGEKAKERKIQRDKAAEFFLAIANADCDRIAIENPVGVMGTRYRKADQTIQPFMFGDPFEKKTCLWLKGIKKLESTKIVNPEKRIKFSSGKTMPGWYVKAYTLPKEERSRVRSKTFPGIAQAMADQWGTT